MYLFPDDKKLRFITTLKFRFWFIISQKQQMFNMLQAAAPMFSFLS